jgi:hypothetical protein
MAELSDGDLAVAWRLAMAHHLGRGVTDLAGDPETGVQQAAACLQELERRVQTKGAGGHRQPTRRPGGGARPHPREIDVAANWEVMAAAIEEYRFITEERNLTRALAGMLGWLPRGCVVVTPGQGGRAGRSPGRCRVVPSAIG